MNDFQLPTEETNQKEKTNKTEIEKSTQNKKTFMKTQKIERLNRNPNSNTYFDMNEDEQSDIQLSQNDSFWENVSVSEVITPTIGNIL